MATYLYTTYEAGKIDFLPIDSSHQKVLKQLYKNRRKVSGYSNKGLVLIGGFFSHIRCANIRFPYKLHSVFFVKNGKVTKIWDASLNGFRPKKSLKFINQEVVKQIIKNK
jgi:hypothetical protein